jgi:hypothetical protein
MIDVIYFDLRKAFDKINLKLLLNKLKNIGITGTCLSWISSFLLDRAVSVKIGNTKSKYTPIESGVPQGCSISPLLFNLYISDLANSFQDPNVSLKFFADDCKAYIIHDKVDMYAKKASLESFIAHFESWCLNNGQELNVNKCFALYLGNNNPKDPYSVCNTIITTITDSVRDLGLMITPDLKWKKHTQSKISSTLRKWYNFIRVIKSQNLYTLCHIYKSYIRPTLEFPSVIFNSI